MKVCRELGGPLTNAGLVAAVIQLNKFSNDVCYKCCQKGHFRKQCPENEKRTTLDKSRPLGICHKCKNGKHWANECRSTKDIDGRPLQARYGGARPKNGQRGPHSQGPQIYGALQTEKKKPWPSLRHLRDQGEPLWAQQDWTSTPPPDSY
jgi:hypothetical protein